MPEGRSLSHITPREFPFFRNMKARKKKLRFNVMQSCHGSFFRNVMPGEGQREAIVICTFTTSTTFAGYNTTEPGRSLFPPIPACLGTDDGDRSTI